MSQIEYSNEFDSISPYTDEEAMEALAKVAVHPVARRFSKFMFPGEPDDFLSRIIEQINTIEEFQTLVMSKFVYWVMDTTIHNFSYDGIENFRKVHGQFLALSNHRDIILDPAITQLVLYMNNMPMTEIAVGDNLLSNKYMEYMIRSNRMIRVIRGISSRSLYLNSQLLSKYIRYCITTCKGSIWLAQREGRTKDGVDTTEQGLLKMLDMSGTGTFTENFMELNIVPLSISYEYEPCDIRKARERLIARDHKYVKGKYEDLESIMLGIKQPKGNVHLNIGAPLTREEVDEASLCTKNDRYQFIRHAVDKRVISGYKLWKTNYMGYDLMTGDSKYANEYTPEDLSEFKGYIEQRLCMVEPLLDRDELRANLLGIYGNPVLSKERLSTESLSLESC